MTQGRTGETGIELETDTMTGTYSGTILRTAVQLRGGRYDFWETNLSSQVYKGEISAIIYNQADNKLNKAE